MLTIVQLTLHEALRRKVLLMALALGLGFLAIFALGFNFIYNDPRVGRSQAGAASQMLGITYITMAGLYAVNFLMVMMSALLPVDTLSGEIRSGAIQTLVTKPLRRAAIIAGKWLAFWLILALYLALMAGGVILIVFAVSGYVPPNVHVGLPLMLIESTFLMTLSIAGGARLSTLANGVMVFGLYGLAFIGSWIEQIGTFFGNQSATQIGIVVSLIVPSEALWKLAAYNMQPTFLRDFNLTLFSPMSVPSNAMVGWAIGYIAVALLVGIWQFSRRDL